MYRIFKKIAFRYIYNVFVRFMADDEVGPWSIADCLRGNKYGITYSIRSGLLNLRAQNIWQGNRICAKPTRLLYPIVHHPFPTACN
jgi:hypothetical protein